MFNLQRERGKEGEGKEREALPPRAVGKRDKNLPLFPDDWFIIYSWVFRKQVLATETVLNYFQLPATFCALRERHARLRALLRIAGPVVKAKGIPSSEWPTVSLQRRNRTAFLSNCSFLHRIRTNDFSSMDSSGSKCGAKNRAIINPRDWGKSHM